MPTVEPMQVDMLTSGEENENEVVGGNMFELVDPTFMVDNPNLDLESVIQGFTGLARLYRLNFIATHCPSLRIEALNSALAYVAETFNVSMYQTLHKKLAETPSSNPDLVPSSTPSLDTAWIESRNKKAALRLEKLDTDLKNYKSNSIKESIRRGHDDLGDHFLECGELDNALKCYSRARDYCTSGSHVVNMCLNVIKVSVYLQNWSCVITYVNKALNTPEIEESSSSSGFNSKSTYHQNTMTRLYCAYGLAELGIRKYKSSAKRFLQASLDHCDIPDMMSTQNVATYGGLCALATFDRAELKRLVISSSSFKLFLELDPALREAILNFYASKYGACLKQLDDMKDNLLLDIYLAPHVPKLYAMIRNRALIQYFSPYTSADLTKMAHSFNTSVSGLENELMTLILEDQIQARIDSHNKILYAQDVNLRNLTFQRVMEMGEQYQRGCKVLILRSAILKRNIVVQAQTRDPPVVEVGQQNN
uniref:PCI domain-containing protein n=1 Tax=Lepeophtheirus salmonis TaxID=72036 RepID=A0A0K2ULN8_LEPSM